VSTPGACGSVPGFDTALHYSYIAWARVAMELGDEIRFVWGFVPGAAKTDPLCDLRLE